MKCECGCEFGCECVFKELKKSTPDLKWKCPKDTGNILKKLLKLPEEWVRNLAKEVGLPVLDHPQLLNYPIYLKATIVYKWSGNGSKLSNETVFTPINDMSRLILKKCWDRDVFLSDSLGFASKYFPLIIDWEVETTKSDWFEGTAPIGMFSVGQEPTWVTEMYKKIANENLLPAA